MSPRAYGPEDPSHREIENARDAGIAFLLSTGISSGPAEAYWRDFDLYLGASDEWVTAYAACALAATGDEQAHMCAVGAWRWLQHRATARRLGFAFNGQTSPDADSTAWACRLGAHIDGRSPALASALAFLETCRRPDGGIATYPSDEAVRAAIRIPAEASTAGWTASHLCVTAAAAGIPCFDATGSLRRFLRDAQTASGCWRGYWWSDPEYTTSLAIECLVKSDSGADRSAVSRALEYLQTSPGARSPFSAALRILALRRTDAYVSTESALVAGLLASQNPDGSWPASARLRIPPPGELEPDLIWNWDESRKGFFGIRLDINRIFTTATAVRALSLMATECSTSYATS